MIPDQTNRMTPNGTGGRTQNLRYLREKFARKVNAGDDGQVYLTCNVADAAVADRLGLDSYPLMGSSAPIDHFSLLAFTKQLDGLPLAGMTFVILLNERDRRAQQGLLGGLVSDGSQKRTAARVAKTTEYLEGRAAVVRFLYLPDGPDGGRTTFEDFLAVHGPQAATDMVTDEKPETEAPKASAADMLLAKALEATLFRSERKVATAHFFVEGSTLDDGTVTPPHHETWPVDSEEFEEHLRFALFNATGKTVPDKTLKQVIKTASGIARYKGSAKELSVRVAMSAEGDILYDIGNDSWQRLKLTPDGCEIAENDAPMFRRHAAMEAQVMPAAGAPLENLRRYLNLRGERQWHLLLTILVACFFPKIAHPVAVITGEHGCAKTTMMKILGRLIDPSRLKASSPPTKEDQFLQTCDHSWLVRIDNLSYLPQWLSDGMCRAVTGESALKRKLYTNAEDYIVEYMRCIWTTCIEAVIDRPDLLDRAIMITLEPIPKSRRQSEQKLLAAFEGERPLLFGALLDLTCKVLGKLPDVDPPELPRLADFARIGVAVERVLGWEEGTFLRDLNADAEMRNLDALDALPIGNALLSFTDPETGRHPNPWRGTAQELLDQLNGIASPETRKEKSWPKAANSLSNQLKRISPNLRAVGLDVLMETLHAGKFITLTRISTETIVAINAPPNPDDGLEDDGLDDDRFDEDESGADTDHVVRNGGRYRDGRDDDFRTDDSEDGMDDPPNPDDEYAGLDLPDDGFPRVRRAPSADLNDDSDLDLSDLDLPDA